MWVFGVSVLFRASMPLFKRITSAGSAQVLTVFVVVFTLTLDFSFCGVSFLFFEVQHKILIVIFMVFFRFLGFGFSLH
jgi:hypothetical protein